MKISTCGVVGATGGTGIGCGDGTAATGAGGGGAREGAGGTDGTCTGGATGRLKGAGGGGTTGGGAARGVGTGDGGGGCGGGSGGGAAGRGKLTLVFWDWFVITTTRRTPGLNTVPHGGPKPPSATVTGSEYVSRPVVIETVVVPVLYAQKRPDVDDGTGLPAASSSGKRASRPRSA